MNHNIKKIGAFVLLLILFVTGSIAQSSSKLLVRDSLDYTHNKVGANSDRNEFNPIPYKGGLLLVSNKKSATNPTGFNKVYWIPQAQLGKSSSLDSLKKKYSLNDDFTAPTSNDNNILTHYTKAKARKLMNAVEQQFADFNPDQSFAIDDSATYIVYPKKAKAKVNGIYRWELWQATLQNGRTIHDQRIKIIDSAADYLYPYLLNNATQLYFASNRAGGKGGFDIYTLQRVNGQWQQNPVNVEAINTEANEIFPVAKPDTLLYTSDRVGGMGGYDLYRFVQSKKSNQNLGYPINTINDDVALTNLGEQYYLTSNRAGSLDIIAMNYAPVFITINGLMTYANDGQLVPNQKFYVYDTDENVLVDSIVTDANAKYNFKAKPNRNYVASAINADGIKEFIAFKTNDQLVQKTDIALNLLGRSPKQIKDSVYNAMVVAEKKIADSIEALGITSKYIVYYGFDKSVLSNKEKKTLDALAAKVKNNASQYLIVGAFTDCVGSFKYNYTLSVKRARYAVQYLIHKGVPKSRFTSNGYSKNYTITTCDPHSKSAKQQLNRRAEIVLSDVKNTNWANLEKARGKNYYASVISTKNANIPAIAANVEIAKVAVKKENPIVKKELVKEEKKSVVKEAVKEVVKLVAKSTPTKETALAPSSKPVIKQEHSQSGPSLNTQSVSVAKEEKKPVKEEVKAVEAKKETVLVANASTYTDEYAKEEILKALDSLATLKKEQERIIEYMTKRINKKPIDVFVSSDSVTIEIYDNGIHDKDSVSVIYNNRIIVDRQELKVNKPIKFKLKVDKNKKNNELVMVAENLGSEPPNTAVMFITEKSGRRQQVMLSTDMTHNEVVYFIRIGKE